MPYTTHESEESVVLEPATTANAAVIWLHGLGADGYDFVPIVDELRLPPTMAVRFIFPHARPRPSATPRRALSASPACATSARHY